MSDNDELVDPLDPAWLEQWSRGGDVASPVTRALVGELGARHREERLSHGLSMVALLVGAVVVVMSSLNTLLGGGSSPVPVVALLLVLPLLVYIAAVSQRRWRERQRVMARPPAQFLEVMRDQLKVRADELRWGKMVFPLCCALVIFIGALGVWLEQRAAVWMALGLGAAVQLGAGYVLYIYQPHALRQDQARYEALRAELERGED